jgi:hypothetical protein
MRSFLSRRLTNPALAAALLGLFACSDGPGTKGSTLSSRPDPIGSATAGSSGSSGSGAAGTGSSVTTTGGGEGGAASVGLAPAPGSAGSVAAGSAGASAGAATEPVVTPAVPLAAFAYVGGGNQISLFSMAADTGVLTPRGAPLAVTPNPSFLGVCSRG